MYENAADFIELLDSSEIAKNALSILQENTHIHYERDISIDNRILIVGENEAATEFYRHAQDSQKYDIGLAPYLESINGSIGDFTCVFDNEIIHTSQCVLFLRLPCVEATKTQLGIELANNHESKESLIAKLDSMIGDFTYENTILYDDSLCQFHHREKTTTLYCHKCADICPTTAITMNPTKRELEFSNIDCITCGKCVSVCPSGAMQKTNAPLRSIAKAARLYKNTIPLLISAVLPQAQMQKLAALINNNAHIAPLVLPHVDMLNEIYLLEILQESGRGVIIFGEMGEIACDCAAYTNKLLSRIYGKNYIYHAKNAQALRELLESGDFSAQDSAKLKLPQYHYNQSSYSREGFAARLSAMIKNDDYGILPNSAHSQYAQIHINDDCTLCNACVEACNTNALKNSKDSFEILGNSSLCSVCGYCEDVCPENALIVQKSGIRLHQSYFAYDSKAKDSPFACVECGEIFASQKSIRKIEAMMIPIFTDPIKKRTLLCCSDCKVRLMFREQESC